MLEGDSSVQAADGVAATVNGEPLDFPWKVGVDSIAISSDGKWLYYASIYDQHLYRVATDSLNGLYNTTLTVEVLDRSCAATHWWYSRALQTRVLPMGLCCMMARFTSRTLRVRAHPSRGLTLSCSAIDSAITEIDVEDKQLTTLVQDKSLLR